MTTLITAAKETIFVKDQSIVSRGQVSSTNYDQSER